MKITALKDVHVMVSLPVKVLVTVGDEMFLRPTNTRELIYMRKGESRSDISAFLGIHAKYLPLEPKTTILGHPVVTCLCSGMERQEFHGLVRTEKANVASPARKNLSPSIIRAATVSASSLL
jgi:hypothetical protein